MNNNSCFVLTNSNSHIVLMYLKKVLMKTSKYLGIFDVNKVRIKMFFPTTLAIFLINTFVKQMPILNHSGFAVMNEYFVMCPLVQQHVLISNNSRV